jgi:hypothetical protein
MPHIECVVVNHNTSPFAELAVRSLLATHPGLDLTVTVMDNASTDDTGDLRAACADLGIPYLQSGLEHTSLGKSDNTHGEVLRSFILTHPDADYYLLLDADICFVQENTLLTMQRELDADDSIFAVQARMSWDGVNEMPGAGWHIAENEPLHLRFVLGGEPISDERLMETAQESHGILNPRCHPGCALVRNTPVFRSVVEHIGLSTAWLFGVNQPRHGFYDTFGLACHVMKTHEQRYVLSSAMVLHYFCVSYDPMGMDWKTRNCLERLEPLRFAKPSNPADNR